ncbi:MAG: serine/threonine protein kinase [Candidatus Solibacter usitatus]|nr:serine/threonine protein kinase [Candidatus Solibacter usitatus]
MKPERWQQVKNVLAGALELPAAERSVFLEQACGEDTELLAEVNSLLAEDLPADFIEQPPRALVDEALDDVELTGQRIGPYRVLRELGRGGMGAVYLAERADEEYRQQVAIKLVQRGLGRSTMLARFRQERQILATLEHPNIARLLDGGTTAGGLPYLVMEYIDGEPIDVYCRHRALNVEARLKLFQQACAAVHFAHQRLVIHRDLKPGNILVTGGGVVKLLDFGIAKLLSGDAAADETVTGLRLMTPAYASPEQVKAEPVTTASDVYSLGVVLYELLTGRHPYRPKTENPLDMVAAVVTETPERPSVAAEEVKERRRLAGDVDNIVLMALRKEPRRRYQSAADLYEDIERHVGQLPVRACADTFSYRAGKFLRRNRIAVTAALLVATSVVAGVVSTVKARNRAERRFEDVRRLAHSILFDYHDAIAELPGSTPVRQRLVQDALRYLDGLAVEASGDRGLQLELASAYDKVAAIQGDPYGSNLGDAEGALKSYRKALEIRETLARSGPVNAALQSDLAASFEQVANVQYSVNDLEKALPGFEKALRLRTALESSAVNKRALAQLHIKIGELKGMEGYQNLGDVAAGLDHFQQALRMQEELAAAAPKDFDAGYSLSTSLLSYSFLAAAAGEWDSGVANGRKAIRLLKPLVDAHPENTKYRAQLAAAYVSVRPALAESGLIAEAIALDREAVRIMEQLTAADPKNVYFRRSVGVCYNTLGLDLKNAGDYIAARENIGRAIASARALSAEDPKVWEHSDDLWLAQSRLGETLSAQGDWRGALRQFEQAAAIRENKSRRQKPTPRDRFYDSAIQAGIGASLQMLGDSAGAMRAARLALAAGEDAWKGSPKNVRYKSRLAQRHMELGRLSRDCSQMKRGAGLWKELSADKKVAKVDASKPEEARQGAAACIDSARGSM